MTLDQLVLFATHAIKDEHQYLTKLAHTLRAAHHAEGDDFKKFLESLEVEDPSTQVSHEQGARSLLSDFRGGGFLTPRGSGRRFKRKQREAHRNRPPAKKK